MTVAEEMGRYLAELLGGDAGVQRLWVRPARDYVELWVLTESLELERERALYAVVPALHARFATVAPRFHPLNSCGFPDGDPLQVIPADATELPLRRA